MTDTDSGLEVNFVLEGLGPSLFATNFVFHETVKSTNMLAKQLALTGAPEGTLVIAEKQTEGKGRMGRSWVSPGFANLYLSLLLRPTMEAEQVFILTMILALATIGGIQEVNGLSPMIKWPNDIYVGYKKLGGILTEFSVRDKFVEYAILGLGLNVNRHPGDDTMPYPATSICSETGKRVSREHLLVRILKYFESYYREAIDGTSDRFYEMWNTRSILIGKRVALETKNGRLCGKATRVDKNGALIIVDDYGRERKVLSADVSVQEVQEEIPYSGLEMKTHQKR